MKCPKCSGAGYIYNNLVGYLEDCSVCNGTGEVQMTNEEWLHTLNTEQLAKVLKEMTDKCATCDTNQYDQRGECPFERCRIGLNEFVEWLKEKHE